MICLFFVIPSLTKENHKLSCLKYRLYIETLLMGYNREIYMKVDTYMTLVRRLLSKTGPKCKIKR